VRRSRAGVVLAALLASVACMEASPPPARSILFVIPKVSANRWPSDDVVAVGDLDADGRSDLVVCDLPRQLPSGETVVAVAHSSRDGKRLFECASVTHGSFDWWRQPYAAGDIDADGAPDIAIGGGVAKSPIGAGEVLVFSGRDGRLPLALSGPEAGDAFGRDVAAAGDLDGDGLGDLLVSAGGSSSTARELAEFGAAFALTGRDGSRIWELRGTVPGEELGSDLCALPDVDGDGTNDALVGASGREREGRALLVSGRDGHVIREYASLADDRNFGTYVDVLSDQDGDGSVDLLIQSLDRARLHSGASGALLRVVDGVGWTEIVAIGDADGDGLPEFVGCAHRHPTVGPIEYHALTACLLSGVDGRELAAREFGDGGPPSCPVLVGDVDGDGLGDLALSTRERVYFVSSRRFFFD